MESSNSALMHVRCETPLFALEKFAKKTLGYTIEARKDVENMVRKGRYLTDFTRARYAEAERQARTCNFTLLKHIIWF